MYNYYPDEIIEEIRINNDIADVVSEYVKLEKRGINFFGLCPFHKEKTASFCVSPSRQIFSCFGCGKGGNVIHFIMNVENLDFVEALKHLADRSKIQLPENGSKEESEKVKLKQELIKINTEAARFFYNNLNSKQSARQYLKNRGISDHTLKAFGIGYADESWDMLFKYLLDKGFDEKTILKSGLIIPNKSGGFFDRFRSRIIFPIFDVRGIIIGFGGRVTDSSSPKYMNSPETPVYNKGKSLYALNFAKRSDEKRIIIVEGYMDVISLHQSGIINTVASLGTALTESQGRLLKKYSEEIIISYDADTAGQTAAMRGLDLLNDIGCNVKVLIIPEGKDPDEFIRKNGPAEFVKLIERTLPLIEYKAKMLKDQIETGTTEGNIKFLNKIADILTKIGNYIEREMYIKNFSKQYMIPEESLRAEIDRRIKPKTGFKSGMNMSGREYGKKVVNQDSNRDSKLIHDERMLLALLCVESNVYRLVKDKIRIEDFIDIENRRIAEIVINKIERNKGIVSAELLSILDKDVANDFARIIQEECNCEDFSKAVLSIIKRLDLYKLDKRQHEITELLKNKDSLPEGDVKRLRQESNSITIMRRNL